MTEGPLCDLIVLIPGITGSVLQKGSEYPGGTAGPLASSCWLPMSWLSE